MTDAFDLAEFLPYRLALISERVSRRLEGEYSRSHGLTVAEWRVLVNLRRLGKASVRDIQVVTNLEKSRVSRAVGRLEEAGHVEKQASKRDARLVEIVLSDKGKATLRQIIPAALEIEERLLSGISKEALAGFYAVFEELHRVLDLDLEAKPRLDKHVSNTAGGGSLQRSGSD